MARLKKPAGEFDLIARINEFTDSFETDAQAGKMLSNGLFGYFTHEAVEHFETIKLKESADTTRKIPVMQLLKEIVHNSGFKYSSNIVTLSVKSMHRRMKSKKKILVTGY